MFRKAFCILLLFSSMSYGFINVEPPVIGEKKGIDAEISLNANYNSGNSNKQSVGAATKGQYSTEKWLAYFIAAYHYGESNGQKDTDDGLGHLRYIHTLFDSGYDYELFCQTEFNEFQHIKVRNLIGANIRKKLDIGFDKFFIGMGLFHSYQKPENESEDNPVYRRTKLNTYISFLKKFNQHFNTAYLGYYQPNIEAFSDYTVSQTLQLNNLLTENLTLSIDLVHQYNATPYNHVEKSDFRSTINLRYQFR